MCFLLFNHIHMCTYMCVYVSVYLLVEYLQSWD